MSDNMNRQFDPKDIEANKTVSMLAYLIFFLPYLVCPQSPFGRFHANQALLVFLMCVVGNIIGIIPFIGGIIGAVLNLASLIFLILGMVNTSKGLAKELPIIGSITIIK